MARVMPTTMGPPLKRDRARQVWEGSLGPAFKEIQPPSLDRKKGRKREPSDAGLCIISPSMLCSSRALYTSPFTSSRWYSRHASKGSPHSSSPRPAAAPRARASVHWQTDVHPTPKQLVSGIKTSSVPRRSNSRDKNPHFPKWGQQAKNLPEMWAVGDQQFPKSPEHRKVQTKREEKSSFALRPCQSGWVPGRPNHLTENHPIPQGIRGPDQVRVRVEAPAGPRPPRCRPPPPACCGTATRPACQGRAPAAGVGNVGDGAAAGEAPALAQQHRSSLGHRDAPEGV